jgi:hypothetical protein
MTIRTTKRYKLVWQALALKERVSGEQRQEHYETLRRIFEQYGLDPIVPHNWLIMAEYYAMLEYGFPFVRPVGRPKKKKKVDDLEFAEAMKAAAFKLLKRGGPCSDSAVAKEMAKDPRCRGKVGVEALRKRLRESLKGKQLSREEIKELMPHLRRALATK